jgi:tRNA(fMet)-specific endonuclease VapC
MAGFRYFLDTNIVSYFVRGGYDGLTARMRKGFQAQDIAISAIVRAELRYGLALMQANDRRRVSINLFLCEVPALSWTPEAADLFGALKAQLKHQGMPIGDADTQIAAHAIAEKLILVTHNTRHFANVPGLRVEDWMA